MSKQIAGTENEHFNIISVLYHTLESATTFNKYLVGTPHSGGKDITQFFQKAKRCQKSVDRAEELLVQRIGNFVARQEMR